MTPFMRRMMVSMAPSATTWNPADKSGLLSLSGGNLTATNTGTTTNAAVRATHSLAGLEYWEVTIGATASADTSVGIGNAAASLVSSYIGNDTNGLGYLNNGSAFLNGVSILTMPTYTTGDVIGIASDQLHSKVWFRKNGGSWNNDVIANQNPATNTGGSSLSSMSAGPYFPIGENNTSPEAFTANFGASGFTYTPPAGFSGLP